MFKWPSLVFNFQADQKCVYMTADLIFSHGQGIENKTEARWVSGVSEECLRLRWWSLYTWSLPRLSSWSREIILPLAGRTHSSLGTAPWISTSFSVSAYISHITILSTVLNNTRILVCFNPNRKQNLIILQAAPSQALLWHTMILQEPQKHGIPLFSHSNATF